MTPQIFITKLIPEAGLELLRNDFELEINSEDRVLKPKELIKGLQGKCALLCQLADRINAGIMDSNKELKIISNYAVGYDNIDIAAATQRKIIVTNTPGVLTETTADLAWALIMSVSRRIVEGDKFIRAGKFKVWSPMLLLGGDIHKKTLGIIGLGRIGEAVARRAAGFSMKIIYVDKQAKEEVVGPTGARSVSLKQLLQESDFVSLHVSLSAETKHLIGEPELRLMKKTAYLVNTSRGPVVDERVLAKALKEQWIAGAGLDVYEKEPEVNSGLLELDNVVLLPHLGSASFETRSLMARIAAQNILTTLRGETSPHIVNPEALKD